MHGNEGSKRFPHPSALARFLFFLIPARVSSVKGQAWWKEVQNYLCNWQYQQRGFWFQPRPQGFSLKKWVGRHPFFWGESPGHEVVLVCIRYWKRFHLLNYNIVPSSSIIFPSMIYVNWHVNSFVIVFCIPSCLLSTVYLRAPFIDRWSWANETVGSY